MFISQFLFGQQSQDQDILIQSQKIDQLLLSQEQYNHRSWQKCQSDQSCRSIQRSIQYVDRKKQYQSSQSDQSCRSQQISIQYVHKNEQCQSVLSPRSIQRSIQYVHKDKQNINHSILQVKKIQQKLQEEYYISKPHILIKEINLQYFYEKYHVLDQNLHKLCTKSSIQDQQYVDYKYQQNPHSRKKQQFSLIQIYLGLIGFNLNYMYIKSGFLSMGHCKIQKFQSDLQPLCKEFITFLSCREFGDEHNPLSKLPNGIIRNIFEYARKPHGYHIMEFYSFFGTFLKLKPKQQVLLKKQDIFTIGLGYELQIYEIFQTSTILQVSQHNDKFLQTIKFFQNCRSDIKLIGNFNIDNANQKYYWLRFTWTCEFQTTNYLISSSNPQIIQIKLNQIIINNTQIWKGRFKFQRSNWYLCDGDGSYSTWKKLQRNRYYKLSNQDTIKLARTAELQFSIPSQQILKNYIPNKNKI